MPSSNVGAFAAKTHLSSLLERVERGEEFVITRHGRAVARLLPAAPATDPAVADAVARLRELRGALNLGPADWQAVRLTVRPR